MFPCRVCWCQTESQLPLPFGTPNMGLFIRPVLFLATYTGFNIKERLRQLNACACAWSGGWSQRVHYHQRIELFALFCVYNIEEAPATCCCDILHGFLVALNFSKNGSTRFVRLSTSSLSCFIFSRNPAMSTPCFSIFFWGHWYALSSLGQRGLSLESWGEMRSLSLPHAWDDMDVAGHIHGKGAQDLWKRLRWTKLRVCTK